MIICLVIGHHIIPASLSSTQRTIRPTALLDTPAIIGIAAGGAGAVLLLTVVCLLMVCVYCCARRGHEGGECLRVFCVVMEGGFLLSCAELMSS